MPSVRLKDPFCSSCRNLSRSHIWAGSVRSKGTTLYTEKPVIVVSCQMNLEESVSSKAVPFTSRTRPSVTPRVSFLGLYLLLAPNTEEAIRISAMTLYISHSP